MSAISRRLGGVGGSWYVSRGNFAPFRGSLAEYTLCRVPLHRPARSCPLISSIEITNFRGIREGKLENLTPLTILVKPNGCGKSTVLDAMLIGTSQYPGTGVTHVVQRHSDVKEGDRWLFWRGGAKKHLGLVRCWTGRTQLAMDAPARTNNERKHKERYSARRDVRRAGSRSGKGRSCFL